MSDPIQSPAGQRIAGKFSADLKPRAVSGVLLAALALALDYAGVAPLALLVGAVGVLMCWEWGHIVRGTSLDAAFWAHAAAAVAAVVLTLLGYAALGLVVALVGMIIVLPLSFGKRGVLSAVGVGYVAVPSVVLVWLRSDPGLGFLAVLFLLLLVAMTDIAAYFGGRLIGGPKLWPRVSPNKTWAGLISGLTASAAAGALFALAVIGASPLRLTIAGLLIGLVAQAGDLAESALKRGFGVKDASGLLPGHGGFLDRMDGVVMAAAAVGLYVALAGPGMPGRALLVGG